MSTDGVKKHMKKNKKLTREERLKLTIKKKIDKHAERQVLMNELQKNSMNDKHRELLKSSSSLGAKETNKESIARQKKEMELNVVLPKDISYYKDVDINKKVIRPDKISDDWDDYKEPIIEKSTPIEIPTLAPETLDKLQFEKTHKLIEKRREEKSKKKYFFWKENDVDRDYDEYQDVQQDKGSYLKNKENSDSEDERTIQLNSTENNIKQEKLKQQEEKKKLKELKEKQEKELKELKEKQEKELKELKEKEQKELKEKELKEKELKEKQDKKRKEIDINNNTNNNNNKKQKNEQVKVKNQDIQDNDKDEIQLNNQEINEINDEINRYNLSIEIFGKQDEENKEIILREKTGIENVEERMNKEIEDLKPIEYNVFHVKVERKPEIEAVRSKLPILMEEHSIVEKIKDNDVVIICGETGSGKTTQVPQFLYESGFGHKDSSVVNDFPGIIGVTQPRRVAAVSTAKRVAEELNVEFGKEVGYQIRYDKKLDTTTNKIKFMTDGILMREVQNDFLLSNYSCILIDEAHERNLNTDILIGLLSRIVPLRKKLYLQSLKDGDNKQKVYPLKLVIMSATLRVEDFTKNKNLFVRSPPVINIQTRQFPVTIHFNKKTELINYIDEAYKKVIKIHKRLPDGGILVFVTGKQEIEVLCSKLRRAYPMKSINKSFKEQLDKNNQQFKDTDSDDKNNQKSNQYIYGDADDIDFDSQPDENYGKDNDNNDYDLDNLEINEDDQIEQDEEEFEEDGDDENEEDENEEDEEEGDDDEQEGKQKEEKEEKVEPNSDLKTGELLIKEIKEDDDDEDEKMKDEDDEDDKPKGPLYVLPLYSTLPTSKQMRVFQTPPLGARLVVIATNLAETSLTIPNIKYVVDTGRVKQRYYNQENGISSFEVGWTSKASADQRAGRAGRTGPGHCYRVFSSAVYNDHFEQFSKPEILMIPIDGMVLQMKSMGIQKITGFPFPTPPDEMALKLALRTLVNLGALELKSFAITDLGMKMAQFPVSPRHSKMLLLGQEHNCLPYIIAIVSILTIKEPFAKEAYENPQNDDPNMLMDDADDKNEKELLEKEKEERMKHNQRIRNSMRKWQHKDSDLLSILKVVGAYDYQIRKNFKQIEQFCQQQFLNPKSMSEIHKLRQQLSEIVNSINTLNNELDPITYPTVNLVSFSQSIKPPTPTQELFIKQVVTAGLIDQVAKIREIQSGTNPKNLIEYQTAVQNNQLVDDGTCFIHPTSNLQKGTAEYVIYCDIIQTSRPYMKLVTEINPSWLPLLGKPLCADFKPLEQPSPYYSLKHDKVRCYIKPNFGTHHWELPLIKIDHPDQTESIRYFAKSLLEGQVFNPLKYLVPYLTTTPSIITQPNTQNKVFKLINSLKSKKINSKEKLLNEWINNPNYLFDEYLLWLNIIKPSILKQMWPPLDSCSTIPLSLIK